MAHGPLVIGKFDHTGILKNVYYGQKSICFMKIKL